jgi:hypothetical protein
MARGVIDGQLTLFDVLNVEDIGGPHPALRATFPRGEGCELSTRLLKPLTLDQLRNLEPFRAHVWIENRDFGKGDFLELFPAEVGLIGRSITTGRDYFHFGYTFTNGRRYDHERVDEFYGCEWRVWPDRPTDEERRLNPWTRSDG